MNKDLKAILILIAIVIFAFFIHGRLLGNVSDADGFYHLKHAWIYKTGGIFQSAFPWTQYSAINQYSADIWYGFHIILIPFAMFGDLLEGMTAGSILITIISLALAFSAFKKLELRWPLAWTAFFALASADLLYRITMLRPHPLSLGIILLLFAWLANTERKIFDLGIIFSLSLVFSWIHLSLSWIPILVLFVFLLVEILQKKGIQWPKASAIFLGLAAGWLLRPNPLGAAKLAYIQVIQLLLEKNSDLPLRFGRELVPFYWVNFADQLIPITILFLIASGFVVWLFLSKKSLEIPANLKTALMVSFILSIIFFILTFAVARRSNEIFIGFAVIFTALVYVYSLQKNVWAKKDWKHHVIILSSIILLIFMPIKTMLRFDSYLAGAFPKNQLQEASQWLKENSKPGEIVFNIHWDRFAQLFFWNHQNYYINGMDPIFQYAYDPASYWKTHFYSIDAATSFTCPMVRCTSEEVKDTYKVLKEDFKASYILVEAQRYLKLLKYLESAPKFNKVLDTNGIVIFKIL